MINSLVLKSYDYLMNDAFERIRSGKHFDANFKPYSEEFIRKIILYFEKREEFEKCKTLVDFIDTRFNHNINYNKI